MSNKGNRMFRQNQQSWQRKQWNQGGTSGIPPLMGNYSNMDGNNMSMMSRMNNQDMPFQNMSSGMNNFSSGSNFMNMPFSSNQQGMMSSSPLGGSMNKVNLFSNSQSSLLGNFNPLMATMSSQINRNDFITNSNKRMRMDQGRNWSRQGNRTGRRDFNARNKNNRTRSLSKDSRSPIRNRNRNRRTDSEGDESDDSKDMGQDKYDPASPTEDNPVESEANGQSFLCHACNIPCGSQEKFFKHLQSKAHQMIMDAIGRQYDQTAKQMEARLKAEEHLRKIEKRSGRDNWGSGKVNYCTICQVRFSESLLSHRRTKEHKRKKEQVYPECRKCRIKSFPSRAAYEAHCRSDQHLKNWEEWHKRRGSSSYGSQDEDSQFDPNEFVTVDATGIFEDELSESRDDDDLDLESDDLISLGGFEFPEYDSETPVGQEVVIAVSGFFCRLCHKFYKEENSAKATHCQSLSHYNNFKRFKLAKQKKLAASKRKAEDEAEDDTVDKETMDEDMTETTSKDQINISDNSATEVHLVSNTDEDDGAAVNGNDNNNILEVHSLNPADQQALCFENLENLSFPTEETSLDQLTEDIE